MAKKRQIYIHEVLPDQINDLLADSNVTLIKNDGEKPVSMFCHGGEGANLFFSPIKWTKINKSPVGFINRQISEWDIPKLILKRFFGGEGELGPEENYKGVLQKSGTIKILDINSLGHFSDVITSFATSTQVNPIQIRNFSVLILSYLEYLNRSEMVSLPLEVDYGVSQDSFFLQIHCDKNEFSLENILEATEEQELKNPFVSLLKESIGKVDLLEIYTLKASSKLVMNACWISNPNFTRTNYFPSLLIHQVNHLKDQKKTFGANVVPDTFYDPDLKDFRKAKIAEKLPTRQKGPEEIKEAINPVLIKRFYNYINDYHKKTGYLVSEKGYDHETLLGDIVGFPDKEALERLNPSEKDELVRIILENAPEFLSQVEDVKSQIESDEYLEGILSSLSNMTAEEAEMVVGENEDLGEENQLVKGSREDLTEESQMVGGDGEDLTEESQVVSGVVDEPDDESRKIEGEREDLAPEAFKVNGSKEEKENLWEVKKSNVQEKIKGIINDRRLNGATHEEIDKEVQSIIKEELNLSEENSEKVVSNISDAASDQWLKGGVDAVNETIKQRIKIEKIENQLGLRETQVEKMKGYINSLKLELGNVKEELQRAQGSVLSNSEVAPSDTIDETEESSSQHDVISSQIEKISELRDEADVLKQEKTEAESNFKEEISALKSKSVEDDRVLQKLKNEVFKLEEDNDLLQKKIRESVEQVAEIRDSDEDTSAVVKENESLKAQIEALKKRMNFMYENSKNTKEISMGTNEVQKLIEDKERFFEDKIKLTKELDSSKADLRESERILKQKELEIKEKNDLLQGKAVGEDQDEVIALKKQSDEFKQAGNKLQIELKASQLKTKSLEQKIKFMSAQLDKYTSSSRQKSGIGGGAGGAVDPKVAHKIKQTEMMNKRLKEAGEKIQKELQEKKGELHKTKMENKALGLKVKELEKKLGKKAA